MPDYGFRLDLPFLHEEIDANGVTDGLGSGRIEEEAARTEVGDAGDVFLPVASPENPNVLRNFDA